MKVALVLVAYDKMSSKINEATNKIQNNLSRFGNRVDRLSKKSFEAGKQLGAAGLAVAAPLYQSVKAATDFESKMIDIGKQISSNSPQEYANKLSKMSREVQLLGRELPIATGEIQEMIASGLRMGVAESEVIGFSKNVAKMSVAFDMGAGEISDSMGKIANVFKIPISQIGEFADSINYLDDNTMAKGPELIDVLQRIGGSSKALTANQAAALASTMLSLGESAETSGSGISAMINRLSAATMQSGKFKDGLQMLGISAQDLQSKMANPASAQFAILDVLEGIQNLKPEKQTEALVRLFGAEHGPKLMKLANNLSEYKRQLALVNGQQKGSMDKEYQKRVASSAAQVQMFKNRLTELSVKIGTTLLPSMNKMLSIVSRWMDKISSFIEKNPKLVEGLAKGAAIFSACAIAGSYLNFVFGGVLKFINIGAKTIGFLVRAFNFLRIILLVLRVVILAFPIVGWIIGIATAVFLIYKNWSKIVAFFRGILGNITKQYGGFLNFLKAIGKTIVQIILFPFTMVLNFINTVYKSFFMGGKNIVLSLIDGIKSMINAPVELIKGMAKKIRNLLPFSPAKDGPLKDIHKIKLVETIAESIKPSGLLNAMRKTVSGVANFLISPKSTSPHNSGAGFALTVNINITGAASKQDTNAITSSIRKEFEKMMQQYINQKQRISYT